MARDPTGLSIVQIEKRLLGAMCQAAGGGSVWALAEGPLQNYRWREPSHAAVFAALGELPDRDPVLLRDLFPAVLTRKGFPDLAWQDFFEPCTVSDEEARRLVQRLLDSEQRV